MAPRTKSLALAVTAGAVTVISAAPHAAEWIIDPAIGSRLEYNDNTQLSSQNRRAGVISSVGPGLRIARNTEVSTLVTNLGVGYNHNTQTTPRNYGSWIVGAQGRYRDELTTYSTDVSLLRDSTLATELFRTGIVQDRVQRNFYGASTGITRTLTERWSVNGALFGSAARYDQTGSNGISDNDVAGGSTSALYAWAAETTFSLSGSVTRYRATTFGNQDRNYSANVSLSHVYSERLRFNAGLGTYRLASHVETAYACLLPVVTGTGTGAGIAFAQFSPAECTALGVPLSQIRPSSERSSLGGAYDSSLAWQISPRSTLSVFARRGFNPSGVGTLVRTTAYGGTLAHQFSERLRGALDISSTRSASAGLAPIASGSFHTVLASLTHTFSPQWTFDGGLRYVLVDYANGSNATARAVYFALRHDFDRIPIPR